MASSLLPPMPPSLSPPPLPITITIIALATLTYQRLGVVVIAVTLRVELRFLRAANVVQSIGFVQAGDELTRLLLAFLRRIMRIGLSFSASAR